MALHRLLGMTVGVPDTAAVAAYYRDWGLSGRPEGGFATLDGGRQLLLRRSDRRHLLELEVGVDDTDDLDRIGARLKALGLPAGRAGGRLVTEEPVSHYRVAVRVAPREREQVLDPVGHNQRGHLDRIGTRASGVLREGPVRPRKLGHIALGSRDLAATQRFFIDGLGFLASDYVKDKATFMRCSTDHHNVVVQQAPVDFLHHTAWQVDDIDEVGRGARAMLQEHPERHVWGLGRHHIGSNFFWYLRDPAGHFAEYYSDLDCIVDDQVWKPEVFEGDSGMFSWGPPPPPSFADPEDLAALMTGTHSARS